MALLIVAAAGPSQLAVPGSFATGTPTSSSVPLTWTYTDDDQTGFEIRRSTDNASWSTPYTPGAAARSQSATGLSAETLYYFQIRAVDSGDTGRNSDWSSSVSATTDEASAFTPLLHINFDGLSDTQAVWGSGSVADKRWDGVPGDNPYSSGYGMRASTSVKYSGKTSSCSMSIASGSTGYPGDGGTGGGFGGWINLQSRGYAVTQGQHLWWRVRIYLPSDWSWSRGDSGDQIKLLRMEHNDSGQRLDLYVLNGNYDWNIGNGESSSVPGSACAGYAFRNEVLSANRPHAQTDFTSDRPLLLGQWNDLEIYTYAHSDGTQAIRRMWVNGGFIREQVGEAIKWRDNHGEIRTTTMTGGCPTLESSSDFIKEPFPFTYWNGGAPKAQTCYIQDMVFHKDGSSLPATDEFGNALIGTIDL